MLDRSPFSKVLVEPCPTSIDEDYCCHAYTLQVHKDPEILRYHQEIFVDLKVGNEIRSWSGFPFLYKKGLILKVDSENDIQEGDLILYFDHKNYLTHSGRMKNGRVISKWGGRAKHPFTGETLLGDHLWMHQWEDIPGMYRSERPRARFYRMRESLASEEVWDALLEFKANLWEKINAQR